MYRLRTMLAAAALFACSTAASADAPLSVGVMTFDGPDKLLVADWRGGQIHAYVLPPSAPRTAIPFNLKDVVGAIATRLATGQARLRIEDMVVRPGSELAYLSLTIDWDQGRTEPAIVSIDAAGRVERMSLDGAASSVTIADRPIADARVWRDVPLQTLTVTDMHVHDHKLYVAGLSNRTFSSTLRVYDLPLTGRGLATSVEMYHPVHNQIETRAPVRTLTVATIDGEPTLIMAYTCTPLVALPVKALRDGAHLAGKTIAELGWGSSPIDLITFDVGGQDHALLLNSSKSADLMPMSAIAAQIGKPGITTPIVWPTKPLAGVEAISIPLTATMQIDNQNASDLLALRREDATGLLQLVSIPKGAYLRISDFVNEYDFADFQYKLDDPFRAYHRIWRAAEGFPELAR